jgi:hypothetical protein
MPFNHRADVGRRKHSVCSAILALAFAHSTSQWPCMPRITPFPERDWESCTNEPEMPGSPRYVVEHKCLLLAEGRRIPPNVDQHVVHGAIGAADQLGLTSPRVVEDVGVKGPGEQTTLVAEWLRAAELYQEYISAGLTGGDFANKFTRLPHLKALRASGILDESMRRVTTNA